MTMPPLNPSDPLVDFEAKRDSEIKQMPQQGSLFDLARRFMTETGPFGYTYHFDWLGRPIIQFPQDIVAFQELVWRTRLDLIIETGVAHGGSLVLSASLLALLDMCDASTAGSTLDPRTPARKVVGIDIDIGAHNRRLIEAHPLASRIHMIQGSSVDSVITAEVARIAKSYERVMICLDSYHTHAHLLAELHAYAPLVTLGCYCIVWDTSIEDVPKSLFPDRSWGPGDNPKTAVREYLRNHPESQCCTGWLSSSCEGVSLNEH